MQHRNLSCSISLSLTHYGPPTVIGKRELRAYRRGCCCWSAEDDDGDDGDDNVEMVALSVGRERRAVDKE